MADAPALSPTAKKTLIIGTLVVLVPILGLFGWVIVRLQRPAAACPLCAPVASGDPAAVERAIAAGGQVTSAAWQDALERVASAPERDDAALQIVRLLAAHGGDPNDLWRPTRAYTSGGGITAGVGRVSVTSGATRPASSRRRSAGAVVAAATDDPALIELLLAHGLDVHGQSAGEALTTAAAAGHVTIVSRLLAAGVPADFVPAELPRRTALAEAIQTRNLELIRLIEAAGGREW